MTEKRCGICLLSVVPVRKKPSDKSEQISQLLFGDLVKVLLAEKGWLLVKIQYDGYTGWIDEKQIDYLSSKEFDEILSGPKSITTDLIGLLHNKLDNSTMPILFGSVIPGNMLESSSFKINHVPYLLYGATVLFEVNYDRVVLLERALMLQHCPYMWGGKSVFGLDCSGFVQLLFKTVGVSLPRDSVEQVKCGEDVYVSQESVPGDLAFFGVDTNKITHVGILLPENRIIHASGSVRIDLIDHMGIFNQDISNYTHKLQTIKSILPIYAD